MTNAFSPLLEFTQVMVCVTRSMVFGGKTCPVAGWIVSATNLGTAASKTKLVMGTLKPLAAQCGALVPRGKTWWNAPFCFEYYYQIHKTPGPQLWYSSSWGCTFHIISSYIYLEPMCPLFVGFNPPKQGPFQSKQGSFGFQVYIYRRSSLKILRRVFLKKNF